MSRASVSRLRVRHAETDRMGVAWHGSFFAWFEVRRTDLLRGRGMTYRELEAAGLRLTVLEAGASAFSYAIRRRPRRLPPDVRSLLQ